MIQHNLFLFSNFWVTDFLQKRKLWCRCDPSVLKKMTWNKALKWLILVHITTNFAPKTYFFNWGALLSRTRAENRLLETFLKQQLESSTLKGCFCPFMNSNSNSLPFASTCIIHTWTEIRLNTTWVYLESEGAMGTGPLRASKWAPTWYVCRLGQKSLYGQP